MEKQLIGNYKILPVQTKGTYKIKELEVIKKNLATTKSKLDTYFARKNFGTLWKQFEPFIREKHIVSRLGNTDSVSNAWLKCYEILIHFDIIDKDSNDTYLHFDNAAFPGSFVLATHHLVKTKMKIDYKWIASSLYDINESNKRPLEDSYGLYENYPANWLMDKKNNGDVLLRETQERFHADYKDKVSLYTSDLGFDVSNDYNNQELIQLPANIGQILSGLLTLKAGGCFITKQYMNFEAITVSIIYAVSQLFDDFYICKPHTSRKANSETYLVGIGFKESIDITHDYIVAMFDRIIVDEKGKTAVDILVPLFKLSDYPKKFLENIIGISKVIFGNQISQIDYIIEQVELASNNGESIRGNSQIVKYQESVNDSVEQWYMDNRILPIHYKDKLKTNKFYYHKKR